MLKAGTLAHRIFNQLKLVPEGLTNGELAEMLIEPRQSIRRTVYDMVEAGLLSRVNRVVYGRLITNAYKANTAVETGFPRDTVEIESVISVNEAGEYSVQSRVVGGLPTAYGDNPKPLHVVRHTVTVPKPEECTIKIGFHDDLLRDKKYDTMVIEH